MSRSSAPDAVVDPVRFRQALGSFATGITVITAHHPDEGPVGLTANSFTSVSLAPPLVLFCAADSSTTWPAIRDAGHFCVNILAEHQEDLSRVFTTRGNDRFREVTWRPARSGAPILTDVAAWLDCAIVALHDAGDHTIVVGRVDDLDVDPAARPLLYHASRYARLAPS